MSGWIVVTFALNSFGVMHTLAHGGKYSAHRIDALMYVQRDRY